MFGVGGGEEVGRKKREGSPVHEAKGFQQNVCFGNK